MVVGTILLTGTNVYCLNDNSLPERNHLDKELLATLCFGKRVTQEGFNMLPPSIRKLVTISSDYEVAITIKELDTCDLLLVSRSKDLTNGRKFRLDNFKLIEDNKSLVEVWLRK